MPDLLRKANNFVGDRLALACDTIVEISNAIAESFTPLEKHRPDIIERFVQGQKSLFQRRKGLRDNLLA